MTEHPAYAAALEIRARQIAADRMGLVTDPTGADLPDDLWRQCLPHAQAEPFQSRVGPWMDATFGAMISGDKEERAHRFLEEALELVQSTGTTASEAHQLVDYVFGRSVGETHQEVGGVMVTLAALCLAHALDMHEAGETELARVWTKVDQIRAKQAAKPKHSPLPEHTDADLLRIVVHPRGDTSDFVEIENAAGRSVALPWVKRPDGLFEIHVRAPAADTLKAAT